MIINQRYLRLVNRDVFSLALLLLLLVGCKQGNDTLFNNPDESKTGIEFTNTITETDDLNILDYLYFYNGGGVAIGDINNDGLPDLFLSGNQVKNRLYLNTGDLKFKDITEKAGVSGNSSWNTGAIMGDINGDGLLDIYVCAVVGINGFNGHNELYINNGDQTFTESAAKYKLDFDTYSSNATLLDYDLDGDLDMYLLNHAVHTQESFGNIDLRNKRNYQTGDKLLRNDNGTFTDVSEEAGIFGGVNGYGLGLAVSDFNMDGYPDIYVGNDFHEDDYYYINNGDGTFSERLKDYFGHTSRFSMGNDVADINQDGWPDLISLDMLPEDEKVLKSSEGDDNIQIQKLRIEKYGYHYQFTRNMLYVNQQDSKYLETALLSGISATDWSWSSLFGDYDQDGIQDLFISNGIPKRPNDLDYINFASSDQIQKKIDNTKLVDQQALDMMPSGNVRNYVFKGQEDLMFEDRSLTWIKNDTLISGATAMGDLDNDGDPDLVVNNINEPISLYINQTNEKASYLKIKLEYKSPNTIGIGSKVYAYNNGNLQFKELYTIRGFQASSEPMVHFGFKDATQIDSVKVVWPDKTVQVLKNVKTNQTVSISYGNTKAFNYESLRHDITLIFNKVDDNIGINFTHEEDRYIDFNRQKLIPFKFSDRGPAVAIGDLNTDGKDDIFFGGSKYIPSKVFLQEDENFSEYKINEIIKDSIKEDVSAIIADFNGDEKDDLYIGSGGADFFSTMQPLTDSYYVNSGADFVKYDLPDFYENASVTVESDYDNDGDLDIFVASNITTNDYGNIPKSYILQNESGKFNLLEIDGLANAGMITDAVWNDYNSDGTLDLIVVGEWMSPKFFKNINGELIEDKSQGLEMNGLWQQIEPFDIDQDGDTDYLLGNWGTNTKFKASDKHPMRMYYSDFDNNGSTETIVCTYKDGAYYPLLGLNELASQIVSIKKRFRTYKSFAGTPIDGLFDKEVIDKATILEVEELRSGYLRNDNGEITFVPFNNVLQVSPITSFLTANLDSDPGDEVLVGGNYFGVTPFHGRFDSFPGALIKNEESIILGNKLGLDFSDKAIRHLNIIKLNSKRYLMATINNDQVQIYEIKN
ncbi:MAG: VCBS repeat-containing protein [Flavobacteriaceae bacterium]|nr:VCBS repeat-containing protein [Flavobacteriaceae bacterium]